MPRQRPISRAAIREGREEIARDDDTSVETADAAARLYAALTGRRSIAARKIAGLSRGQGFADASAILILVGPYGLSPSWPEQVRP